MLHLLLDSAMRGNGINYVVFSYLVLIYSKKGPIFAARMSS